MTGLEPADLTSSLPLRLQAGLAALERKDPAQAAELAGKALAELDSKDHHGLFAANYLLLRSRRGQVSVEDVRHGLRLVAEAEALNRNDYRTLAHSELGELYRLLGMHDRAGRHLRESLRHADSAVVAQMALPFLRLGLLQLDLGEPGEALVRLERARNLFRLLSHAKFTSRSLVAEARALTALGRMGAAISRLENAESVNRRPGAEDDAAAVQRELGRAKSALGDLDGALAKLKFALYLHANGADPSGYGHTTLELAELNLARQEPAEALTNMQAALQAFSSDGDLDGKSRVLRLMASVHEQGGEHEAALGALKEHLKLRNELQERASERASLVRIMQLEQSLAHEHSSARRTRQALVDANRKLREQSFKLEQLSRSDHLTGLLNRRHLTGLLEREFGDGREAGQLALILLDVDSFKAVNDRHGHAVGDAVLARIAVLLQQGAGNGVAVARWGGEEFAVMLPGAGLTQASALAEKICGLIRQEPWSQLAPELSVSVSAGVASSKQAGSGNISRLIRLADDRLYLAKQEGRDRVVAG